MSVNDVSISGTIDSGAQVSVITQDLVDLCKMNTSQETIPYITANGTRTSSLGTAKGVLAFQLNSAANLVYIDHSFPIVTGNKTMLIGIDLLNKLGLLTEVSLVIRLEKEHNTILKDESEFDHLISTHSPVRSRHTDHSTSFNPVESGCTIELDNQLLEEELTSLLEEFRIIFQSTPHPDGIDCPPMEIPFHDESTVVKRKPRYFNPEKLKIANGIFDELIEQGFAVSSPQSKFSSPVVLVTYPDHRKPRLTGDYSGTGDVNDSTVPIASDLPNIADVITFLPAANFIATLDLPKAFWQLKVAPKDMDKTALTIPGRTIKFTRAPFGLKNVPAIFQNLMTEIFAMDGVFIYLDDIIVIASVFDEFITRLRAVFNKAQSARVTLGIHKCKFVTHKHPIKILGSIFHNKTRLIDDVRIKAVLEIPNPKTVKDVRSLVCTINYIRDWLPGISQLLAPIIALTKGKPKGVKWEHKHQRAFDSIKNLIVHQIPLDLPGPNSNILISADASDLAVGGVIWNEISPSPPGTPLIKRKVQPISFFSRILSDSQLNGRPSRKSFTPSSSS
ncbi:hypothetical protein GEMRC1_002263 [Eukaryota sp. GEM-RC1]